jgi:uncharacterized damage-inducible protein DinB
MEVFMREMIVTYAKYLQDKDKKIYALLDGLSNEDREKETGSYYHTLSGLYRHCVSCVGFFMGILQAGLTADSAAKKVAVPSVEKIPEGTLTDAQWKALKPLAEDISKSLVDFAAALTEAEIAAPIQPPWLKAPVPLWFGANMLFTHQIHHQGAMAQILDEMKVDNDFSGIDAQFL